MYFVRYVIHILRPISQCIFMAKGGEGEMGIWRWNGPSMSPRRTPHASRSSTTPSVPSRATPFPLYLLSFSFTFLAPFPLYISLAFCIHRPCAVYAVHFQPVNVRSAFRPSTRYTCSKISLFLHCSILDSLFVLLLLLLLSFSLCFSHQRFIKKKDFISLKQMIHYFTINKLLIFLMELWFFNCSIFIPSFCYHPFYYYQVFNTVTVMSTCALINIVEYIV